MGDSPLGAWLRQQGEDEAPDLTGGSAPAPGPGAWGAGSGSGPLAGPWEPEGSGGDRRGRLRLLAGTALAVVLVLAGVAVGGRVTSGSAAVGAAVVASPRADPSIGPRPAVDGAVEPSAAGTLAQPPSDTELSPDAAGTASGPASDTAAGPAADAAVGAAAAMAVRATFSDATALRFVDHAVAVDLRGVGDPAAGLRLVTVAALVLDGGDGGWRSARQARYAVLLRDGPSGPQAVSEPWPLPDPPPAGLERGAPLADPAVSDAVAGALEAAGYAQVEIAAVSPIAVDPTLLMADVVAVPPGGGPAAPHALLLTADPSPALLGTQP